MRENADKRFFGTLGQLKRRKKENPDFIVCVCGCMMQQQHVIDTIKAKYPWVDIIFGTHNIHQFPELIDNALNEKKKQIEIWPDGGEIVEGLPAKRLFDSKALVNIMFGLQQLLHLLYRAVHPGQGSGADIRRTSSEK